ncbi:MAG TPA: diguanylate cyclase [Patescibacteria group bacterium]|nr:diguanylate cyclase [Patescibacteria group bacterium]
MPSAVEPTRPAAPARAAQPARAVALLREALLDDPSSSLLGPRGPHLAPFVTALYAVVAIGHAEHDAAIPFAVVPLTFAALTLTARWGAVIAAITYATALFAELVVAVPPDLNALDIVELIAFGGVSLALRLAVVRLSLGRAEIDRGAVQLRATRAQVDEARESTERWVAQLEVAQRAAARMAGRASVRDVAETVVDEIRAIVDYHACRVYVVEEPDSLVPVVAAGESGYETIPLEDLRLRIGEGFTGWVAANGRPLLVPDANADPRGVTIPGTDEVEESMVVVPMRYDERVTGVITLSKLGLRQFDVADVRILSILADQAATAIESARAIGASAALADDLRRIADMSSALSRSLDPGQVADLIAQHMGRAFEADEGGVSTWDRPGDRLLTLGYWPHQEPDVVQPVFELARFPETRRVLETQAISLVDTLDPAADPAEVAHLRSQGQRALVMLPLVAKGETIGLVELVFGRPLHMEARRLDLARAMANEAAMALGNARLYETTRALVDRDPLTGFFNHRYLHERLGEEILRAQRSGAPLALLMLDLDDFKFVNDTLGHLFGDEVLRWTAEQIRSTLRSSDVAARYGGDEFAVILPDTPPTGAHEAGERIVAALRDRPYQAEGRGPVPVSASVGVASYPADGRSTKALIAGADAALYRVKESGGKGVQGRVRRRLAPTARRAG